MLFFYRAAYHKLNVFWGKDEYKKFVLVIHKRYGRGER